VKILRSQLPQNFAVYQCLPLFSRFILPVLGIHHPFRITCWKTMEDQYESGVFSENRMLSKITWVSILYHIPHSMAMPLVTSTSSFFPHFYHELSYLGVDPDIQHRGIEPDKIAISGLFSACDAWRLKCTHTGTKRENTKPQRDMILGSYNWCYNSVRSLYSAQACRCVQLKGLLFPLQS